MPILPKQPTATDWGEHVTDNEYHHRRAVGARTREGIPGSVVVGREVGVGELADTALAEAGEGLGDLRKVLGRVRPGVVAREDHDRPQGDAAAVGHLDVELGSLARPSRCRTSAGRVSRPFGLMVMVRMTPAC
jgi:hypothetical protein